MPVRPLEPRDLDGWIEMRRALWPSEDAAELADEAAKFVAVGKALTLAAVFVSEDGEGRLSGFVEVGLRRPHRKPDERGGP
jgi:hypothetical protein